MLCMHGIFICKPLIIISRFNLARSEYEKKNSSVSYQLSIARQLNLHSSAGPRRAPHSVITCRRGFQQNLRTKANAKKRCIFGRGIEFNRGYCSPFHLVLLRNDGESEFNLIARTNVISHPTVIPTPKKTRYSI